MKEKMLGKVKIEAEANSPETLEKLLEQALFELKLSSTDDNGFQQALTKNSKGEQSGTMGSYSFNCVAPVTKWDELL